MYHHFAIAVSPREAEAMIEKLNAAGIYDTSYESPIDVVQTIFGYEWEIASDRQGELRVFADDASVAGLPESYLEKLERILGIPKARIRHSIIDDWNRGKRMEIIDLGNGWIIAPPDLYLEREAGKQTILFDPQGAFGTGLHETTQDCLRMILRRDFQGQRVADLGAGSGILSIAVQLKGADSVFAADIEPVRDQILYNASLNGARGIEVARQNILDEKTNFAAESFDCVIINIGGEETLQFVQRQRMFERYRGSYLISGLVEWSENMALAPFLEANYAIAERLQTNEWVTAWLEKRQTSF